MIREKRNTRGFTILEVLVIIVIIALLVAVLMPVLSRARGIGRRTACLSNLHQLGLALELYASNRDDRYPSWSRFHAWGYYGTEQDGTDGDDVGPAWTELLKEDATLPGVSIYSCPAYPSEIQLCYFQAGYAAWARHGGERSTRRSWIDYPAQFLLSGDSTDPVFFPPPYGDNTANAFSDADIDNASVEVPEWSRPVHLGKDLNLLFADGHTSSHSKFDRSLMTFDTKLPGIAWGELDE